VTTRSAVSRTAVGSPSDQPSLSRSAAAAL
jgi:hypothetical protein